MGFLAVSLSLGDETTPLPRCQNFECPDNSPEGGLWPDGDGCSGTFCECSYGIPYQLECEEANPPLFFNPARRFVTGASTCVTRAAASARHANNQMVNGKG